MVFNPFADNETDHAHDQRLADLAVDGDSVALEELLTRHRAWIYNIVIRMAPHPQDAEDLTQDILIKVINNISGFRGESSFRTWLYRIVANHVLNAKKSAHGANGIFSFDRYGRSIDATPDSAYPLPARSPEMDLIVEEIEILCMMGMLLCLDREERVVFVLGAILGVNHNVGSALLGTEKSVFRKKLSRARKHLHSFMEGRCSLLDRNNPCHCIRKTRALIQTGEVDPQNLVFRKEKIRRVKEIVPEKRCEFNKMTETICDELFRRHPFFEPRQLVVSLKEILKRPDFQETWGLREEVSDPVGRTSSDSMKGL